MSYYIGIDPDTKCTGLALIGPKGLMKVKLARAKGQYAVDRMPEMAAAIDEAMRQLDPLGTTVAIEIMHIRPHERNPNSIILVQAVAGIAISAAVRYGADKILTPIPSKWKGTVPKPIHQKRLLAKEGIDIEDPVFKGIPKSMRNHVVDGIGLARWAESLDKT
jgi:hypothetical protein